MTQHGKLTLPLTAYRLSDSTVIPKPGGAKRQWMEDTDSRFANRCLPMLMANQAGWHVCSTEAVTAVWDGGDGIEATVINFKSAKGEYRVSSHFGYGIITWEIPLTEPQQRTFKVYNFSPRRSAPSVHFRCESVFS